MMQKKCKNDINFFFSALKNKMVFLFLSLKKKIPSLLCISSHTRWILQRFGIANVGTLLKS